MPTLVEDLDTVAAYPGMAVTDVQRITTHVSWVFCTDREVFKVKRPVSLGFLDFSTVAARRAACEAEVTLNRRLAPDVYLGVVPITRDADGRHRVGGPDHDAVDWAVHMRRLPEADRADVRLAAGRLSPADIDRIAVCLADFHGSALRDEATAVAGDAAAVECNVRENLDQTRPWVEDFLAADQAASTGAWQLGFVHDHAELLHARAADGHCRDGHGDLRLEHVYLDDTGAIRVIDCVEFNPRYRHGDTCGDIAFLAMDLSWHGRTDLSERLLARYAMVSNDHDLYALVDFYQSYRAWVRAKVAGITAHDADAPTAVRAVAAGHARRYFLLALSAHRRNALSPRVVAVGGVIASGKSTVAEALGDALGAPVIEADRTRKSLLGVTALTAVRDTAWAGAYDPGMTDRVYREVLRRASVVLAAGRPVVLDASFRSPAMRAEAVALAARHAVPFTLVECRVDLAVCRDRLRARARHASVSDGRLEIFDAFCARYVPITELPDACHVVLDTALPLARNVDALQARFPGWPAGAAP